MYPVCKIRSVGLRFREAKKSHVDSGAKPPNPQTSADILIHKFHRFHTYYFAWNDESRESCSCWRRWISQVCSRFDRCNSQWASHRRLMFCECRYRVLWSSASPRSTAGSSRKSSSNRGWRLSSNCCSTAIQFWRQFNRWTFSKWKVGSLIIMANIMN